MQLNPLDPVCLIHGKRRSEHDCLYCCLCFKSLTPEECAADESGQKWDVCLECYEAEQVMKAMQRNEWPNGVRADGT